MVSPVALPACAVAITALLAVNLLAVRRTGFPPVLFVGVWAAALWLLLLFRGTFVPVPEPALIVYLVGAVAFSAGGFLGLGVRESGSAGSLAERWDGIVADRDRIAGRIVDVCLILLAIAAPFYLQSATESGGNRLDNFLYVLRIQRLAAEQESYAHFSLLENAAQLSYPLAVLAFMRRRASRAWRMRWRVAIAAAVFFMALSGTRASLVSLGASLVAVVLVGRRYGRMRGVAAVLTFTVVGFLVLGVFLRKLDQSVELGWDQNLRIAGTEMVLYGLGGIVAFGQVAAGGTGVEPVWPIWRVPAIVAAKLGFGVTVPSLHAEYTPVGTGLWTNVYTCYFSYFPDFGWAGVIVLPMLVGFVTSWWWTRARGRSLVAGMGYAILVAGICESIFNEGFFLALNLLAKSLILVWLCYMAPLRWRQQRTDEAAR